MTSSNGGVTDFDERALLLDSIRDYAIFMLDPEGYVRTWNAGAKAIKGYEASEIIGQHFSMFSAEGLESDRRAASLDQLARAEREGRCEHSGWRVRKDGSVFWAHIIITPVRAPDGRLLGFAKVTRDLTDRKDAELELQRAHDELERRVESRTAELERANDELRSEIVRREAAEAARRRIEQRFQRLVKSGVVGVVTVERNGAVLEANDEFLDVIGYSREDLAEGRIHQTMFNLPEWRKVDDVAREEMKSHGFVRAYEKEYVRKDGSRVPVLVGGSFVDEERAMAVVIDLRQQREVERDRDLMRARLEALHRSPVIGLVYARAPNIIEYANDAFLRILGYTREDFDNGLVLGEKLTPPEWLHTNLAAGKQIEERGFADAWEKEYFRKDGTRVPVLVGATQTVDGSVVSFVADLSSQKRAEGSLRKAEDQLRQLQKMDAVGRLAGGVAHDFNNMLSVILSYAELIYRQLSPQDPMRAEADEIRNAARRAGELTHQLLLLSRHQTVEPRVLDINEVLLRIEKMLRRVVGEDIALTTLAGSALGLIKVDPVHIEQVILNLVVNARDAMPSGGRLTIETQNVALDDRYAFEHVGTKTGEYVMLAVSDTGVGMDRALQSRIFEPFFTTKAAGKGTGMGLAIVFGIAQQAGGHVWVYSEPGQGTTFKVYFPRVNEERSDSPVEEKRASAGGHETILLVEDQDQVRGVARDILTRAGYHVIEARNPGEAILANEQHRGSIHLLLTDVVMPQLSGPELAQRISRPGMAVLFMSGYTDEGVVRHGMLDKSTRFLQKPFSPDSLTRKVRQVLDGTPDDSNKQLLP